MKKTEAFKSVKSLFAHLSIPIRQHQTGSQAGAREKEESAEVKKGNYLIGYNLKASWLFVTGCPQCFAFTTLKHYRLRFWLVDSNCHIARSCQKATQEVFVVRSLDLLPVPLWVSYLRSRSSNPEEVFGWLQTWSMKSHEKDPLPEHPEPLAKQCLYNWFTETKIINMHCFMLLTWDNLFCSNKYLFFLLYFLHSMYYYHTI